MLSQFSKTIKMALKSTEEERAVLRARSALQRFPVVEWRQRMEDFHKRSIGMSRGLAGSNAWRESDCDGGGVAMMADTDDWNPVEQAHPTQPEWDRSSMHDGPHTPGSPGQWSQDTLTPSANNNLAAPRLLHSNSSRHSTDSDAGADYFSQSRGSTLAGTPDGYGGFLDRANRAIGRDQRHAPDPFLDDGNLVAPNRPFGSHSRVSSVESISSIVDEKVNSPLNKAIASVSLFCSCQPIYCLVDLLVY